MSTSALSQADNDHLRFQLAEYQIRGLSFADTAGWAPERLWAALTSTQADIINTKGNLLAQRQAIIANTINTKTPTPSITAHLYDRLVYQIVPAAIAVTIVATLANLALFFSQSPAPVGSTDPNCTKALEDCQSGLVTSKDLLDKCRGYIPTFKARRDEAMADWKACLSKLEACQNSNNTTLTNNSTDNSTVN